MPVRHRAFALILVLIAVAGVFALAVHSAVVMRTNIIEERVLRERLVGEREARAAAAMALQGLMIMTDEQRAIAEGAASGVGGGGVASGGGQASPRLELPAIVKALLSEAGIDEGAQGVVEDAEAARAAEAATRGRGSGDVPRITGVRFLSVVGIPASAIDVQVEGRAYRVSLSDALGLLNINEAPAEQLLAYFTAKGIDASTGARLADQMIDWRDADDQPRPLGAERDRYSRLGIAPRNDDFATIAELRYLPAMTPELFELIRADLCLSGDGVHAGSAPAAVLRSVPGLGPERAQRLLDLRAQRALTPKAFDTVVPPSDTELRGRVRFSPSGIVAISVASAAGPGPTFEGVATLTDRGVSHLALMPR